MPNENTILIWGAGAIGGTLFAAWATELLYRQARSLPTPPPSWVTFDLDATVLVTTIGVTVGGSEDRDRVPDFDRPIETGGTGYVEYASGPSGVRVHYADHVVTKLEPYTPAGGLRKRVTVGR